VILELQDVRKMLPCPTSKNGLRDTWSSESETLMVILQDLVPVAETLKLLEQAFCCLMCKSLPRFSLAEYYEVYILFPEVTYSYWVLLNMPFLALVEF
jgi:hypothetical protein